MKKPMNRRDFLKQTARTAALAGLGGCGPLLQGCAAGKTYDLVITNALVYDGKGGRPFEADIGLAGDSIQTVGKVKGSRGKVVIEARGLAVSPGFIDVHDHTDLSLIVNPKAESVIHQGITTLVSGQCGGSPFPVADSSYEEEKENAKTVYGVDLNWRDMAGFFGRLEEKGMALNYSTFVGHGTIRGAVIGFNDRPPSPEELEKMKSLVEEHIRGGAFGLSSGLAYTPGSFARPEELTELCRVVARYNGTYATHMRDEEDGLLESLDESIGVAKDSGARLQISHFKVSGQRNWPKVDAALARIDQAKQQGVEIFCDRYPYIASSTGLSSYFPAWALEGTTEDFLRRLQDPALDAKLRAHLATFEELLGSWDKVLISQVYLEKNKPLQGKTILQAAREAGKQPYDFIRDLLIEEKAMVGRISFFGSEDVLKKILAHPLVGVGCDGSAIAPYGILSSGKPHPRNYGTFPRVLGKYVRDEKIVPLEELIKKITAIPASRFGFEKRGRLEPGYFADLVLFDPDKIADRATWVDPHQYPVGVEYVIVNGQVVVEHGNHTGRLPGKILKRQRKED
jgi:N-acyl-D-aspartate/D-glutamate deacylase